MRSIDTRAITFATSFLADRSITSSSLSSQFSNAVAVAKNVWFVLVFGPELAVLIRQSSGITDEHPDDAVS